MSTHDLPDSTADETVGEDTDELRTGRDDHRKVDAGDGAAWETGAAEPAGDGESVPGPAGGSADGVDPEVEKLTSEVAERTADLQRVTAEYANYRRRTDREREAVAVNARAAFVADMLTVLDDFERAGQHGDLTGAFKSAADKVVGVVTRLGLEPFGAEGELFDPSLHEAVQHEPADAAGPTVTVLSTVLRSGYRISDRVLRPAMVTVRDRPEAGDPDAPDTATDEPVGDEPVNPA